MCPYIYTRNIGLVFGLCEKVDPTVTFNMHPYQHGGEENRVQHSESENNPSDIGRDTDTDFETYVMSELQAFLGNYNNKEQPSGERNSRPLQDPNDGEQQSADRHSRPLEDPNDGEQLSADRHSRPLEDPDDGKQPSGDKSPEGEAGKRRKRPGEMLITEIISF